jgi:Fe-S-cluster containining protein
MQEFWMTEAISVQKQKLVDAGYPLKKNLIDYGQQYIELKREHGTEYAVKCAYDALVKIKAAQHKIEKENMTKRIRCRSGNKCSHCCKQIVHTTADETELIYKYVKDKKVTLDEKRLSAQQAAETVGAWGELAPENRTCVFLDKKGKCSIYEYRPMACRMHFVVSDPKYCDTFKYIRGKTTKYIIIEAEVFYSGVMNVVPTDTLSRLLYKHLKKDVNDGQISSETL